MIFDTITQDGTYTLTAEGTVTDALAGVLEGFVVATGALENESDVKPGDTFGRWEDTDTGVIYWDRVEVIDNIGDALIEAGNRGEKAIWDVANSQEIRVTSA